jgi:putative restriction endonuclease
VLEAAHIKPYRGDGSDRVDNGLLLRSDIHTLFDLGQLYIEPDNYIIRVVEELHESEYGKFDGQLLRLPKRKAHWPHEGHLKDHIKAANAPCGKVVVKR